MDITKIVIYLIIGGYIAYQIIMQYMLWKKKREGKRFFEELIENTPYLSDDEIPDYYECSGLIIKNFLPLSDAKIEYKNNELLITYGRGKESLIPLATIASHSIVPTIIVNEKLTMFIRFKAHGFGRLQFTTQDLEPWRTILETAVDQNNKSNL